MPPKKHSPWALVPPHLVTAHIACVAAGTTWFSATGKLALYVNPQFHWILHGGIGIALAIVLARVTMPKDSYAACCMQPVHPLQWLLLILPLLLGLVVPARPLGAYAFGNADAQQSLLFAVGTDNLLTPDAVTDTSLLYSLGNEAFPDKPFSTSDPQNFTILDWSRLYRQQHGAALLDGQQANVIGFVVHQKTLPDNSFVLGRFFMRHCIFDTVPLGLYVSWPDAQWLSDDAWVRVGGRFVIVQKNGKDIPILIAESVERIAQPAEPYLYPQPAE